MSDLEPRLDDLTARVEVLESARPAQVEDPRITAAKLILPLVIADAERHVNADLEIERLRGWLDGRVSSSAAVGAARSIFYNMPGHADHNVEALIAILSALDRPI